MTDAASSPPPDDASVLIIAASETDSDLYHATRFLVGDPVIYAEIAGEKLLLVSDLEYGRASAEATVDRVVSTTAMREEIRERGETPHSAALLDAFLKRQGLAIADFIVPENFPLGTAQRLTQLGYSLTCRPRPFFPARAVKRPDEVEAIRASQQAGEAAMRLILDHLRRAEVRGDRLFAEGKPLTADALRIEAQKHLLGHGFTAATIIIAGGDQGCDPHQRGHGPLPAHATIVIDIFPRSLTTRYWGDLSRTVVRGSASDDVKRMYDDVAAAQDLAISRLRAGVAGRDVHEAVVEFFASRGRENGERDGKKIGFIHSTGHGVGLDIHEFPGIGQARSVLEAGHIVTVEPGLYYPGTGAVRIEDLVRITDDGCENLTTFPRELELT